MLACPVSIGPPVVGEEAVEKAAVDPRQKVEVVHRDPLVDLVHGAADEAELHHRAIVLDEAGIRRAARGRGFRPAAGDGEDGVALLIREFTKGATTISRDGIELATLKAQATHSIDAARLKEQFPEAHRACARKGTTRVLRIQEKAL